MPRKFFTRGISRAFDDIPNTGEFAAVRRAIEELALQLDSFVGPINVTGGTTTDTLTVNQILTALSSIVLTSDGKGLIKGGNVAADDITVQPGPGNWLYVVDQAGALAPVKCGPSSDNGHATTRADFANTMAAYGNAQIPLSGNVKLLVQWGGVAAGTSGSDSITFPTPFSAFYAGWATMVWNGNTKQNYIASISATSTTGMTVKKSFIDYTSNPISGGDANQGWYWLAIGKA